MQRRAVLLLALGMAALIAAGGAWQWEQAAHQHASSQHVGLLDAVMSRRASLKTGSAVGGGGLHTSDHTSIHTSIHSVITSGGSSYQNFQGRVMYGTYKIVQGMPGGERLTGFTRILHRTVPDECMDEIPTFHVKPLQPECDVWCDFPVSDRPNAVAQWIAHVQANPSELKGTWVAMLECDYVWMRPLPVPGDACDSSALGYQFKFGYIMPTHPGCAHIIKRLYGRDPSEVPPSGPAPAVLRFSDLQAVTPLWEAITSQIEGDAEAKSTLDWVREMYAWDIAVAKAGLRMETEGPPRSPTIAQPPSDERLGNASLFHYTWGATYYASDDTSTPVWEWEKRSFTSEAQALEPTLLQLPPPWSEDRWRLQDFFQHRVVTRDLHETLVSMLVQMNRAIEVLPKLPKQAA